MEKLRNDAYPIQSRGNVSRFIIATTKKVYLTCKTENHNLLITGGNELGGNCIFQKCACGLSSLHSYQKLFMENIQFILIKLLNKDPTTKIRKSPDCLWK